MHFGDTNTTIAPRILFLAMVVFISATLSPVGLVQAQLSRAAAIQRLNSQMPAALTIDAASVEAAGIAIYPGEFVTIYSDVRDEDTVRQWVDLFDAAIQPWCDALSIDQESTEGYRLSGMVMLDIDRFRKCGLVPSNLPAFPAGYSRGHEFWLFAQKDDYYTRHLILHEGTHAFMSWFCGSTGPPWYSEGMAEWMALHRWNGRRLQLATDAQSVDQCTGWGRIGTIQKMVANQNPMALRDVFNIPPSAFRNVRYYAWSWAACEFLSQHPLTEDIFRRLPNRLHLSHRALTAELQRAIDTNRNTLERDWGLFINEIQYGYQVNATVLGQTTPIKLSPSEPDSDARHDVRVAANRSWQSTSLLVSKGDRLRIVGNGQFVVRESNPPWVSQSGGITIEYYSGQPLGKLMGCVIPETLSADQIAQVKPWRPFAIGWRWNSQDNVFEMPSDGILCLRINESPSRLRDNSGHLEVSINKLK